MNKVFILNFVTQKLDKEELVDNRRQILKSDSKSSIDENENKLLEKNKTSFENLPYINEKNDSIISNMSNVLKYENHCKLSVFKVKFY